MEPVFRISDRAAFAVTIQGLTGEHAAILNNALRSLDLPVSFGFLDDPSGTRTPGSSLASQKASGGKTVMLTGTPGQLHRIPALLSSHPGLPQTFSGKLESVLDNYFRSDYKLQLKGRVLDLGSRTHLMGILNVTPDSFSDGGRYADTTAAVEHAKEMAAQGADIIDIGGESTRPGSEPATEDEELRRVLPVIERLSKDIPTPLSVDTYKSTVAGKALEAGASLVNDISGLRFSPDMARVVADHGAAVVIMHIRGTPRNMQVNPVYDDVVAEVTEYLEEGVEIALRAGVDREKILIDPGIGFGKTLEHNLILLNALREFRSLGRPIALGTSRKKLIGTVLDLPVPEQRMEGTAATVALGIERGAHVLRVHDVAQMAKVARMTDAILKSNSKHETLNPK